MVLIAEHEGEAVGVNFCFDDLCNTKEKGLIIKTIARNKDAKYKGLASLFSTYIAAHVEKYQYDYMIHALMIKDNPSVTVSLNFNGDVTSQYALYVMKIN
jgi:hypothetical protein